MKSFLKTTSLLLFAALVTISCEGSFDSLVDERLQENPTPDSVSGSSGSADFSNYVAIGNSLTAGFMDGALYNEGQENSMPALLADRLELAGAQGTFNQPDINSELGFNTSVDPNPDPQTGTVFGRFKLDTDIPGPSPTLGGDRLQDTPFTGDKSALDNYGVPGIFVGQLLTPATGGPQSDPAFNPFYARFASQPGSSTILGDAISAQPTFFTLWIGNNDVLQYAISGASNPNLLTTKGKFEDQYLTGNSNFDSVIDQLLSNTNADGVLINIPNVLAIPFFQAVPYNAINLTADEAQQLNAALQGVNDALDGVAQFPDHTQEEVNERKINYSEGNNPVLVRDPALEDYADEYDQLLAAGAINQQERQALVPYEQSRPLRVGQIQGQPRPELLTFSAGSVIGTEANPQSQSATTIGVVIPLGFDIENPANSTGDEFFLTIPEQTEILTKTAQFNGIIKAAANSSDRLALYDTQAGNSAFTDIFGLSSNDDPGITVDGVDLAPDFSPNGVFSTDGIHPNPRGNAIIANEIIGVIEDNFGSSIPEVNVLNLPSVQLCAGNCASQQSKTKSAVIGRITYNIDMTR